MDVTSNMATSVVDEAPEGDALNTALEEIEASAKESYTKITETRQQLNAQTMTARKYAPDVQKVALKEYTALQQKLTEAQKAMTTYRNFKKEYQGQVAAKKAMTEFIKTFASLEEEVQKAGEMTGVKDESASTEDVQAAQEAIRPLLAKVAKQLKEAQIQFAKSTVVKDQFQDITERCGKAKESLEAAQKVMKPKLEKLAASQAVKKAQDAVEKAEQTMNKCTEMEMPFLKGIEVGPGEESNKALQACEQAATQAQAAVGQVLGIIKQSIVSVGNYADKELSKETKATLTEFQETVTSLQKKLADFKTSTAERRTAAVVAEVTELMEAAEAKVQAYAEAAAPLTGESLEGEPLEVMKEALEKSTAVEAEVTQALQETRKCIQQKQMSAKGVPATAGELQKLNAQLGTKQQEMQKTKKTVGAAFQLVKSREALSAVEAQVKEAEAELEKVQTFSGAGPEDLSDETVLQMVEASAKTAELVKTALQAAAKATPTAVAATKKPLGELQEQCKKAQASLDEINKKTQEPRERVLSKTYTEEAKKKADEVEAAMNKVNEAELPFLKGMENLPLAEAQESIRLSKEAGDAAKANIAAARTFIGEKNKELATFAAESAKAAKEELSEVMQRITQSSQALAQFFKDVDGREKTTRVQEAEQMISDLETQIASVVEAAKPFSEGAVDSMPEEEADAACKKFMELEKATQAKVQEVKQFVVKTAAECKGVQAHQEALKPLQAKLTASSMELNKAKKSTSAYEQKITAKRVHEEMGEIIKEMEAEQAKILEVVAPLVEQGGEVFLVQSCVRRLAEALQSYMADKGVTQESLLGQMSSESDFTAFLEKLPETTGNEELIFVEGRPAAMFKQVDADGDGKISAEEFKAMFCSKYTCVKEIAVTDVFEMEKSSSTAKLKPGDIVEGLSAPKVDETGMTRVECTLPEGEGSGFVTVVGNSGATFLRMSIPFDDFNQEADKAVEASVKAMAALSMKVKAKQQEFPRTGAIPKKRTAEGEEKDGDAAAKEKEKEKEGSVEQLKTEVYKLIQKAQAAQASVMVIKNKMKGARIEVAKRELQEKNAYVLQKEQKEVDELLSPVKGLASKVEAAAAALEGVTAPFVALKDDELKEFATPASTLKDAERLLAALVEAVSEIKSTVREQQVKATEIKSSLIADARKELTATLGKANSSERKGTQAVIQVRQNCKTIVGTMFVESSKLLRASIESPEKLCEQLVGPDGVVPEEALCKKLESLEGLNAKPEHCRLICHQIGAGGVGKYALMKFLECYYSAARPTVLSESIDIDSKIVRKIETGEVIELVEGPNADEKTGLLRMKGRTLRDNLTGWVSIKGNKGGVFLEETDKPTYVAVANLSLDADIKGKDGEVCALKAGQVLELVEGPKKEKCVSAVRARGKALKDDAVGWVTVKTRQGTPLLEDGKFYICSAATAMTDELDVKTGKLVKKLAAGEVIEALEEPQEDGGVKRLKAKILKEDKEGFVTLESEAGTSLFQKSNKHYKVLSATPLQKGPNSATETVRSLEPGEAFLVAEGPKDEAADAQMRARGAALGGGVSGWFTLGAAVKPWVPVYTCVKPAALRSALSADEGQDIRELAVNEALDFLDGPKVDASGAVKIKASAAKDGTIGWVAVRDAEGAKVLESKGERPAPSAAGRGSVGGLAPRPLGYQAPPKLVPKGS